MGNTPTPNTDEIRWSNKIFHTNGVYFIKHLWSCSWDINELPKHLQNHTNLINFLKHDVRNLDCKFFCEIYDDVFLHYRAGSNWLNEGIEMHKNLSHLLKRSLL